jgi:hypothetical protein
MTLTRPPTIHYPFGVNALGPNINTLPDTPSGSYLASWQQGFPPITMTPLGAGGTPPVGADFNGVLNSLSKNIQWVNAGMPPIYDATLASAMGGYPVGATLVLSDGITYVVCDIANTTNDPNLGVGVGYGWHYAEGGGAGLAGTPPTTTSSTLVMMGLGSALVMRPTSHTHAMLSVNCTLQGQTSGANLTAVVCYGTGTAPANGAALTGTQLSAGATATMCAASAYAPICLANFVGGLVPGTAYWVDIALRVVGGGWAAAEGATLAYIEA